MRILLACIWALLTALAHVPQPSDTVYTARAAMLVYGSDPERALTIIDSALIVGNVDAFVLKMSSSAYYNQPEVAHGYFRGSETYNYVNSIRTRWSLYKQKITH